MPAVGQPQTAAAPAPRPTGRLELTIARRDSDGRSFARHQYHEGALRVIAPHYLDDSGQVTYSIVNPGGAYFGADCYDLDVRVEPRASLLATTQSATKVYRTPQGPARQRMRITLAEHATLEYLPDPLIVYREGTYRQNTVIDMAPSASLTMAEVVTPGWAPTGQPFRYDEIRLRTEVRVAGRLFAVDQLRVVPAEGHLGLGMMEGYTHVGQFLLVDARLPTHALDEFRAVLDGSAAYAAVSQIGSSTVTQGYAVRALARDTQTLESLHLSLGIRGREMTSGRGPINLRKV